ncbi:hypothetical protein PR048_017783 [Dryococelus australis]|uniref:DDE Tnp4 domain-containing protein n=1 Tax=Dryococelus australis TaxID=614101 RepID=A0ABQ9HAJ8_9NEOP|nr:hypothetical protein PR048_017783 [Dryococelus australis]
MALVIDDDVLLWSVLSILKEEDRVERNQKRSLWFKNFTRESIDTFDYLLGLIREDLTNFTTNWRKPISLEERLLLTLRPASNVAAVSPFLLHPQRLLPVDVDDRNGGITESEVRSSEGPSLSPPPSPESCIAAVDNSLAHTFIAGNGHADAHEVFQEACGIGEIQFVPSDWRTIPNYLDLYVLWEKVQPLYIPRPTREKWMEVAGRFEKLWHYPKCCDALDTKLERIENPKYSGSLYRCYEDFNAIVLQALVDADARFLAVVIGDFGRNSDGGVFSQSDFGIKFITNQLDIPSQTVVKGCLICVGDEGYASSTHPMRPFSRSALTRERRIYNYRHSRARINAECAFGMLTRKF